MIVTIDGPAGSGKSTVAKQIAQRLDWMYLDTGATYRCAAIIAQRENLSADQTQQIAHKLRQADIKFKPSDAKPKVFLNDRDVTEEIRSETISELASKLAADPEIRSILVAKQRQIASQYANIITEGRDQGSTVFADADIKIYLDAADDERARRRYRQLIEQGEQADYEQILQAIKQRDYRDKTRKISPLTIPDDAVVIDTTNLNIEQVVEKIITLIEDKRKDAGK